MANPNNYTSDVQIYFSGTGENYDSYGSCVIDTAAEVRAAQVEANATMMPGIGTAGAIGEVLFNPGPTDQQLITASTICGTDHNVY